MARHDHGQQAGKFGGEPPVHPQRHRVLPRMGAGRKPAWPTTYHPTQPGQLGGVHRQGVGGVFQVARQHRFRRTQLHQSRRIRRRLRLHQREAAEQRPRRSRQAAPRIETARRHAGVLSPTGMPRRAQPRSRLGHISLSTKAAASGRRMIEEPAAPGRHVQRHETMLYPRRKAQFRQAPVQQRSRRDGAGSHQYRRLRAAPRERREQRQHGYRFPHAGRVQP